MTFGATCTFIFLLMGLSNVNAQYDENMDMLNDIENSFEVTVQDDFNEDDFNEDDFNEYVESKTVGGKYDSLFEEAQKKDPNLADEEKRYTVYDYEQDSKIEVEFEETTKADFIEFPVFVERSNPKERTINMQLNDFKIYNLYSKNETESPIDSNATDDVFVDPDKKISPTVDLPTVELKDARYCDGHLVQNNQISWSPATQCPDNMMKKPMGLKIKCKSIHACTLEDCCVAKCTSDVCTDANAPYAIYEKVCSSLQGETLSDPSKCSARECCTDKPSNCKQYLATNKCSEGRVPQYSEEFFGTGVTDYENQCCPFVSNCKVFDEKYGCPANLELYILPESIPCYGIAEDTCDIVDCCSPISVPDYEQGWAYYENNGESDDVEETYYHAEFVGHFLYEADQLVMYNVTPGTEQRARIENCRTACAYQNPNTIQGGEWSTFGQATGFVMINKYKCICQKIQEHADFVVPPLRQKFTHTNQLDVIEHLIRYNSVMFETYTLAPVRVHDYRFDAVFFNTFGKCSLPIYLDGHLDMAPKLPSSDPLYNAVGKIECMNRCLAEYPEVRGFFISHSDQSCACANNKCENIVRHNSYRAYEIVPAKVEPSCPLFPVPRNDYKKPEHAVYCKNCTDLNAETTCDEWAYISPDSDDSDFDIDESWSCANFENENENENATCTKCKGTTCLEVSCNIGFSNENGIIEDGCETRCNDECQICDTYNASKCVQRFCESGQRPVNSYIDGPYKCESCPSGQYGTGTACIQCQAGTYQDEQAQSECKFCAIGRYSQYQGMVSPCKVCPSKTTTEQTGSAAQDKCVGCPSGHELKNNVCTMCEAGKVEIDSVCRICARGFTSLPGTSRACVTCSQGKSIHGTECIDCPVGRFKGLSQTECEACPQGWFQSEERSAKCRKCPEGTLSFYEASSTCYCIGNTQNCDSPIKLLSKERVLEKVHKLLYSNTGLIQPFLDILGTKCLEDIQRNHENCNECSNPFNSNLKCLQTSSGPVHDTDEDGYMDYVDAFPKDSTEWKDSDGDRVGDNSDAFPNDPTRSKDSDGDGYGDEEDEFPNDPLDWVDTDGDGVGDNSDEFPNDPLDWVDTDGDGVGDNSDEFPNDPSEWIDGDNDGLGDNEDDPHINDSDNDGFTNLIDQFPLDPTEWVDSDNDGVGDQEDDPHPGDTDNDGVPNPIGFDPYDASANANKTWHDQPGVDHFPTDYNYQTDTDGDGIDDKIDPDKDGDTHANEVDAFPMDKNEWLDTDGDGIGNNADTDDDNDDHLDTVDAFPMDPTEWSDIDGDGIGDNEDPDKDGDGRVNSLNLLPAICTTMKDMTGPNSNLGRKGCDSARWSSGAWSISYCTAGGTSGAGMSQNLKDFFTSCCDWTDGTCVSKVDAFPNDSTESTDIDGDGIGDNSDPDRDGDGHANGADAFPTNSYEWADLDGDGTGDNSDTDKDGDGVANSADAFPNDATRVVDTDGDGTADWRIVNGEKLIEDWMPNDATGTQDSDMDGVADSDETYQNDPRRKINVRPGVVPVQYVYDVASTSGTSTQHVGLSYTPQHMAAQVFEASLTANVDSYVAELVGNKACNYAEAAVVKPPLVYNQGTRLTQVTNCKNACADTTQWGTSIDPEGMPKYELAYVDGYPTNYNVRSDGSSGSIMPIAGPIIGEWEELVSDCAKACFHYANPPSKVKGFFVHHAHTSYVGRCYCTFKHSLETGKNVGAWTTYDFKTDTDAMNSEDKIRGFFLHNGIGNVALKGQCVCIKQDPYKNVESGHECLSQYDTYAIRGEECEKTSRPEYESVWEEVTGYCGTEKSKTVKEFNDCESVCFDDEDCYGFSFHAPSKECIIPNDKYSCTGSNLKVNTYPWKTYNKRSAANHRFLSDNMPPVCLTNINSVWNGNTYTGCDGARWYGGSFALEYCDGTSVNMQASSQHYSGSWIDSKKEFYEKCCDWTGSACVNKWDNRFYDASTQKYNRVKSNSKCRRVFKWTKPHGDDAMCYDQGSSLRVYSADSNDCPAGDRECHVVKCAAKCFSGEYGASGTADLLRYGDNGFNDIMKGFGVDHKNGICECTTYGQMPCGSELEDGSSTELATKTLTGYEFMYECPEDDTKKVTNSKLLEQRGRCTNKADVYNTNSLGTCNEVQAGSCESKAYECAKTCAAYHWVETNKLQSNTNGVTFYSDLYVVPWETSCPIGDICVSMKGRILPGGAWSFMSSVISPMRVSEDEYVFGAAAGSYFKMVSVKFDRQTREFVLSESRYLSSSTVSSLGALTPFQWRVASKQGGGGTCGTSQYCAGDFYVTNENRCTCRQSVAGSSLTCTNNNDVNALTVKTHMTKTVADSQTINAEYNALTLTESAFGTGNTCRKDSKTISYELTDANYRCANYARPEGPHSGGYALFLDASHPMANTDRAQECANRCGAEGRTNYYLHVGWGGRCMCGTDDCSSKVLWAGVTDLYKIIIHGDRDGLRMQPQRYKSLTMYLKNADYDASNGNCNSNTECEKTQCAKQCYSGEYGPFGMDPLRSDPLFSALYHKVIDGGHVKDYSSTTYGTTRTTFSGYDLQMYKGCTSAGGTGKVEYPDGSSYCEASVQKRIDECAKACYKFVYANEHKMQGFFVDVTTGRCFCSIPRAESTQFTPNAEVQISPIYTHYDFDRIYGEAFEGHPVNYDGSDTHNEYRIYDGKGQIHTSFPANFDKFNYGSVTKARPLVYPDGMSVNAATPEQRIEECSKACFNWRTPSGTLAPAFFIQPSTGRCYCSHVAKKAGEAMQSPHYTTYNFIRDTLPNFGRGKMKAIEYNSNSGECSCKSENSAQCNAEIVVGTPTYVHMGWGICNTPGLGVRMYEGDSDNPGTDVSTSTKECAIACHLQKEPLQYGPWASQGPAFGFSIVNGRCYCNHKTWSGCSGSIAYANYGYSFYDFTSPVEKSISSTTWYDINFQSKKLGSKHSITNQK